MRIPVSPLRTMTPALASLKRRGLLPCLAAALLAMVIGSASSQTVSQSPLSVGGDVPGNLLLVPSVEWPTLDSVANLGNYDVSQTYVGYFDAGKCYKYSYSANEPDRHFYPVSTTSTRTCSGSQQQWSGNFLNWAVTQTIDPFRKALTGGYRVRDTATETWLEKARSDANGGGSIFPDRSISGGGTVSGAAPVGWSSFNTRIGTLGNKLRFARSSSNLGNSPTVYTGATLANNDNRVYEVSIRVKICDTAVGVEANCKQYSQGWKPEGLIQQYAERIRYSAFGYLNDSNVLRDGGVLRAKQKFVGPNKIDPVNGVVANANREWNPTTGVLIQNPDSADATATTAAVGTTISHSGVINYINKFGQMTTQNHKNYDPVSELYYAAIRYLKKQGNVSAYTTLSGSSTEKYNLADGFPVITNWDDPIQYWCQNNAILGIGDANTHRDKNLPGGSGTTDEPSRPAAVSSDSTVNVSTATQKVAQLEGIAINTPFTGRENSAYIAGLAYDSHTKDMRSDLEDKQTVSTYWVDVRENQILEPRARNQYWLAAKYGGFTVPEDFNPYTRSTPLDNAWWSSDETLSTGDPRPENFYVASEAGRMVESLSRAFARIAEELPGSASSLAANSTRLETGTMTFQAQFFSGSWRGELNGYAVAEDGSLSSSPVWQANAAIAESSRKIYVYNPQGGNNKKYVEFEWANLGSNQTAALGSADVVNYLRGDQSKEESNKDGTLRTRTGLLGDIVNSTPVYVGAPNARLYAGATFSGASSYAKFANDQAGRTPVIYVGANDGMLHGFNAQSKTHPDKTVNVNAEKETYAFVPNAVILNGLKEYSDPDYEHRYFVDGEIAAADVYLSGRWRTVLVGTLGRGGPGVFALDVTDPADVQFLWEKSGADLPALGKNLGKPVIAQVADGDWRVLLGNGPGSSGGSAQLIMIGLASGSATVVNTGAGGSNGLSAVLARDSTGDGFADVAYAGDFQGNLWKFAGLSGTATVTNLFDARDPNNAVQAITAAPLAGKDPATGATWVFFGTGQFLDSEDLKSKQVQTWYGIKDTGAVVNGRAELVQRDILAEGTIGDFAVRVIEEGSAADLAGKKGWYIDLKSPVNGAEGERMVVANRFQGAALIGTTRIPDASDVCRPSGRGFVMAINPFTGARLGATFFDVTRDGQFTDPDKLVVGDEPTIVSGIGFSSSPNNPIFIGDVIQVGLDDGTTKSLKIQGSSAQSARMSWREILN